MAKTLRNNLSKLWPVHRELYYAIITPFEIGLMNTEKDEHKPDSMYCLLCFKEGNYTRLNADLKIRG